MRAARGLAFEIVVYSLIERATEQQQRVPREIACAASAARMQEAADERTANWCCERATSSMGLLPLDSTYIQLPTYLGTREISFCS